MLLAPFGDPGDPGDPGVPDDPLLRHFGPVVEAAARLAPRLLDHPALHQPLVLLSLRRPQWIRPLSSWRPQGRGRDRQFRSLIDHLLVRYRVPTFSQAGSREVRYGFLMSISRPSFKPVGRFLAATVAKVLNGAQPRELNQLFEEAPSIAINLKTAEVIGLYLYADVLAAADEIYRDIESPN